MSKTLNWHATRTPSAFEQRETYRSRVQRQMKEQEAFKKAEELRKAQEPLLKSVLLDSLVKRTPITVVHPFYNATETLGGISNDEEDDGFYSNISKSENSISQFQEVMEVIPAGTQLVYQSMDKILQQWIFKSSKGREYAIYFNPHILYQGNWAKNPGYYGLLYNTDLNQKVQSLLGE